MALPTPSSEQSDVLDKIAENNVVVRAVAGAGKTTCILHLAKKYQQWRILLLTYNSNLKAETRDRARYIGLNNLQIHTYHSFINTEQGFDCYNDGMFENFLHSQAEWVDGQYDLLILDEAQDINCLRWRLIRQVLRKNSQPLRMCLLGDPLQTIYRFVYDDPSDTRFMGINEEGDEYPEILQEIYPEVYDLPWIFCHFSVSYRLSENMTRFLTDCTPCQAKIIANPNTVNYQLEYYCQNHMKKILRELLEEHKQEDILILSYTQRNNRMISDITSQMYEANFYVPVISDDINNQPRLHANKIVCLTYHQSKGLERPIVIITDFNCPHPGISLSPEKIPNSYYVAFSRAREKLILIQNKGKKFLPFVDKEKFAENNYINLNDEIHSGGRINQSNSSLLGVMQLIRHKTQRELSQLVNLVKINAGKYEWSRVYLKSIVQQGDIFEDVSNLNGIALPCVLEFVLKGFVSINSYCLGKEASFRRHRDYRADIIQKYYDHHNLGKLPNSESREINQQILQQLMRLALLAEACDFGYFHRLRQVRFINWLQVEQVNNLLLRLLKLPWINTDSSFEENIKYEIQDVIIEGRCDVISRVDDNWLVVYEFKCLNGDLSDEHRLQLITYLAILQQNSKNAEQKIMGVLINILSGETEYIRPPKNSEEFLQVLLEEYKRGEPAMESDEDFFRRLEKEFNNQ